MSWSQKAAFYIMKSALWLALFVAPDTDISFRMDGPAHFDLDGEPLAGP